MPSQRIQIIPANAILDPARCSEWGTPLFAWHPQAGRIAVGGGGLAVSRGAVRGVRAGVNAGLTYSGGGLRFDGTNSVDFGSVPPLKLSGALTLWASFSLVALGTNQWIAGTYSSADSSGYSLHTNSTNNIVARAYNAAGATSTSPLVAGTVATAMMSASAAGASTGLNLYQNGGVGANSAVGSTAQSGTHNFLIGNRNGGGFPCGNGSKVYGVLLWSKAQPARLAQMLDADPTLMWWWPGKTRGRVYSVPAAGATVATGNLWYYQMLGRGF